MCDESLRCVLSPPLDCWPSPAWHGCCWLILLQEHIIGSGSTCPPYKFLQSCFQVGWPPDMCLGFLLMCRIWHFLWLYSIYLLLAHFSNLSSSLWIAAQPYGLSTTSPSFSVICDSGSFLIHILQYLLLVNLVQHFHIWLGISISLPYHSHLKVVLTSLISLLANVLFVQLLSLDIYLPVSPQFLGKVPWS